MQRDLDLVWKGHAFTWKAPASWMDELTAWLGPHLHPDGIEALGPGVERGLCWDDPEWGDVLAAAVADDLDEVIAELGECLGRATLRTYHGTRTADAGIFLREGLKVHDRRLMTERLRRLVETHDVLSCLRGDALSEAIAEIDNRTDDGRLHVVADERFLLDHCAHYLIYGSEWVAAVLGGRHRRILKTLGVPTLLEIDLPLRMVDPRSRHAFARALLQEWTRRTCDRPDWSAPIDFPFCLSVDIPPACVVGHRHPAELRDPLDGYAINRVDGTTCAACDDRRSPMPPDHGDA